MRVSEEERSVRDGVYISSSERHKAGACDEGGKLIVQELCESRGGRHWAVRPNEPSGFRGRKAILNHASASVSACP